MKIIGNPLVTPTPRPDWLQNDPKKANYIENVPEWVKQPEKPTYTAKEVGALSSSDVRTFYSKTDRNPISGVGVSHALSVLKNEMGTVDQTFDPDSTNAQSGVAVAQALSNSPLPHIGRLLSMEQLQNYNFENQKVYLCFIGMTIGDDLAGNSIVQCLTEDGKYKVLDCFSLYNHKYFRIDLMQETYEVINYAEKLTNLENSLNGLEDFLATI